MATGYTRGKLMLKESLKQREIKKRQSPQSLAFFYCNAGLDQEGFEARFISKYIGHGVFTTRIFNKGDFLLEYVGKRICVQEEADAIDKSSFLYGFVFDGKKNWIDASNTTSRLCRLVNDAEERSSACNSKMKLMNFKNYPRLCLFATREIQKGEELRYDYGDDPINLFWRHQVG